MIGGRLLSAAVPLVTGLTALVACNPPAACETAPLRGSAAPSRTLEAEFDRYGDDASSTLDWTGGDGAYSVAVPDGRRVWTFADTFLGALTASHGRPPGSPLVSNSVVVQDVSGRLRSTLVGGTASPPSAYLRAPAGSWYWPADAVVEGSRLRVLVHAWSRPPGGGPLDLTFLGTGIASLALPSLAVDTTAPVVPVDRGGILWTGLVEDGDFTFVHGERDSSLFVARAPRGSLGSQWRYRTAGGGWSTDPARAAPVISGGVGHTETKVVRAGACFVFVSFEGTSGFNAPTIRAYVAPGPAGPWGPPHAVYSAPEAGSGTIVYAAVAHPSATAGDRLLVGYSVNALDPAALEADVHLYRPRFLDVQLDGLPGT